MYDILAPLKHHFIEKLANFATAVSLCALPGRLTNTRTSTVKRVARYGPKSTMHIRMWCFVGNTV